MHLAEATTWKYTRCSRVGEGAIARWGLVRWQQSGMGLTGRAMQAAAGLCCEVLQEAVIGIWRRSVQVLATHQLRAELTMAIDSS